MILIVLSGVIAAALALWGMIRGSRREKPSAKNNWRNEDYMMREADGTWAEGSTYSKSQPGESSGLGL